MVTINFSLTDTEIARENQRDLESMNRDDLLYWCFSCHVDFRDDTNVNSFLTLPNCSIFQLVDELTLILTEIGAASNSPIRISDRYGEFVLQVEIEQFVVGIRELLSRQSIIVKKVEFGDAVRNLVRNAISFTFAVFPSLAKTSLFIELKKEWCQRSGIRDQGLMHD